MNTKFEPSEITLSVRSSFKASHSLPGFETPHFHLWQIKADFKSPLPLERDRLIDIVLVQGIMKEIVAPIEGRYLNSALPISPTSECLAVWYWKELKAKLPDAPLFAIEVSLCDMEGRSSGAARIA